MENSNRIPRNAKKLEVEFLIPSIVEKHGGNPMIVKKTERGWIGKDNNGKSWSLFAAMLRNAEVCKIKVIN